jgi:hypothetical protein
MILTEKALDTLALLISPHLSSTPHAFEDKEFRGKLCEIVNEIVDTLLLPEESDLKLEDRNLLIGERRRIFLMMNARI